MPITARASLAIALCLALLACQASSLAQTQAPATVVFFTPGGHWRGAKSQLRAELGGKGDLGSFGSVFEGEKLIAGMTHTHYVAIHIAPGPHTFSANLTGNHPNPSETVAVDLQPGSTIYFAITTTSMNYGLGLVYKMTSHIQQATCADFASESASAHLEPLNLKHVSQTFRPGIVYSEAIFSCEK